MKRERPLYIVSMGCRGMSSMTMLGMVIRTTRVMGEGMAGLWTVQRTSRSSQHSVRWSSTARWVTRASSATAAIGELHGGDWSSAGKW